MAARTLGGPIGPDDGVGRDALDADCSCKSDWKGTVTPRCESRCLSVPDALDDAPACVELPSESRRSSCIESDDVGGGF